MPDLPHRSASGRPLAAAVASALVVHAAGLGALIACGHHLPAVPAPAAVVEVAMVLEPAPPEPQPAEPTPVASAPVSEPSVAEPAAPPLPEPPVTAPSPAIAIVGPPIPDVAPEPVAPVLPPSVRPPPTRPPPQHVPRMAPAAPRSSLAQQDSTASAAPAISTPTGAGTPASANQEASLEARIRDAVQAAVHYPAAARMMGVTGRARVQFDYRSGAVADPTLAQSSGTLMLDEAALAAARSAHYPQAPAPIEGRLLRLLVWVEFRPD